MAQNTGIYLAFLSTSLLSIAGCIFILAMYIKYDDLKIFAFRLVRDLAVMDLIRSIGWTLPASYMITCQIQAILLFIFSLTSVLWISVITYSLHCQVIRHKPLNELKFPRRARWIVSIISLINLVFTIGMTKLKFNPFGLSGGWCTINADGDIGVIIRFIVFYGPLFIVIFYNFIISLFLFKRFSIINILDDSYVSSVNLFNRLWMYPIFLAICYLPGATMRIFYESPEDYPESWVLFAGIAASSNGFWNALIFGTNKTVRKCIERSISKNKKDSLSVRLPEYFNTSII